MSSQFARVTLGLGLAFHTQPLPEAGSEAWRRRQGRGRCSPSATSFLLQRGLSYQEFPEGRGGRALLLGPTFFLLCIKIFTSWGPFLPDQSAENAPWMEALTLAWWDPGLTVPRLPWCWRKARPPPPVVSTARVRGCSSPALRKEGSSELPLALVPHLPGTPRGTVCRPGFRGCADPMLLLPPL